MVKGLIFDFNGTMYMDNDLNYEAWAETFYKVQGSEDIPYSDFTVNIERLNKDYDYSKAILEMFNKDASDKNIEELSVWKETNYQDKARQRNRNKLTKGLPELLDYLKENNIPYCIASMAPLMNMKFYLDYLHLDKWFTFDNIVYDIPEMTNKNLMYQEAARRMGIDVKDCLLFEDNTKVIRDSKLIGIDKVIYMNVKNTDFTFETIKQEIKDFDEFDWNLINQL